MATKKLAAAAAQVVETAPMLNELSAIEDLMNPLVLRSEATQPFVDLLSPTDSILRSKGEGDRLQIYRELLRDDQVQAAWGQRRLALTSCETVVEAGADDALSKQAAEELQLELDAMNWDNVTDKALFAVFYGWGVAEVLWKAEGDRVKFDAIKVRDRARFRFDRQGNVHLWSSASGGYVQMPERKFWTVRAGGDHDDELYGLGIAHQLYWPIFFKRNDIKFWLVFLEKFGMPTAMAKLPPGSFEDPVKRTAALNMLRRLATDAGVLVPDTVEVELLEAARSGAADYEALCGVMNAAISKIIVGQTMTTDDGSSKSQAEVHDGVKQQIVEADSDMLCGSFNAGPVKWWAEFNFPGATPPRVYRHTEPPEDLNARAERDSKIKALGYSPTEEYIVETYGDGWEKAEVPDPLLAGGLPGAPGFPGARPPARAANGAEFADPAEVAALAALRAARRGDQDALEAGARAFAEQYMTITGRRVGQVLQAAEFADDPDLFRRKLDEILAEAPPEETTESVTRANIFSRFMGALRAQRRA